MSTPSYFAPVRFILGLAVLLMLAGGSKAQLKVVFEFREPSDFVGLGVGIAGPCEFPGPECPGPCHPDNGCFPSVVTATEPSFLTIMTTASARSYGFQIGLKSANEPVSFDTRTIGHPVPSTSGPGAVLSFTSETSPAVTVNMIFDVSNGEIAGISSGSPVFMASDVPTPGFPGAVLFQFDVTSTDPVPSVTVALQILDSTGMPEDIHSGNP